MYSFLCIPAAAHAQRGSESLFDRIKWVDGPVRGSLGAVAEVGVPGACSFTDAAGAKLFMEATQNFPSGDELGVLLCESNRENAYPWFVVFSFDESGYVKDDEKADLDGARILKTIQRGTEAGNVERRKRGWAELEVMGWGRAPYYDPATNNLTWSTRLREKTSPEATINHSVRLLGRHGVMKADLVLDPLDLETAVPRFDEIIETYEFTDGNRYAEWRSGDKVAAYGLTALIAGGAGAAAMKLGLFGKLFQFIGKLWKLLVVAVIGAVAAIRKVLTGRSDDDDTSSSPPPAAPSGSEPQGGIRGGSYPAPRPQSPVRPSAGPGAGGAGPR